LTVTLQSSDTSEAIVSASVTIAAGQTNAAFLVNAVDDTELDGTQTVTISASATGFADVGDTIDVLDDDSAGGGSSQLTLNITPTSISENGGSANATVTRTGNTSAALTVNLSSNSSSVSIPPSVTIIPGNDSASFSVTGVDNAVTDGTRSVMITATAGGVTSMATIAVTDDDTTSTDAVFSNQFED
jgi:hypothetical protein